VRKLIAGELEDERAAATRRLRFARRAGRPSGRQGAALRHADLARPRTLIGDPPTGRSPVRRSGVGGQDCHADTKGRP